MQILKRISIVMLSFSFFGCEFIDTKKVSNEKIMLASNWSINDQPPSFNKCDVLLELDEQKKCFEQTLLNLIHSNLSKLKFESPKSFNSEVILVIKIDEDGIFSPVKFEDNDKVFFKIEGLENKLIDIVNNLPNALPAIKTNVGSYVNVKFSIPIKINADKPE
tara:strand:+ start:486 stop:974 length:489 start_codon:yes stop_codon:yes gene_type:complete